MIGESSLFFAYSMQDLSNHYKINYLSWKILETSCPAIKHTERFISGDKVLQQQQQSQTTAFNRH